ncbi:MAG TPA: hypothetical protein VGD71_35505 [Kribbella sp.]|jgi:hypothetical protein
MTTMRAFFRTNYRSIGANLWQRRATFFRTSPRWFRFQQAIISHTDRQLLDISWRAVQSPSNSPELLAHVRRHLPGWPGFRTRVYTYVDMEWNPIFGELRLPATGPTVHEEVEPEGQRDMLAQLFAACPPGSYGYYAQWGLAPFHTLVGNTAAAGIHMFFASQVQFLKQPMGDLVTKIMSTLETKYWDSRQDVVDHLAGLFLKERGRQLGVAGPQWLRTVWEGQRTPDLPTVDQLSEVQLQEIADTINGNLADLDASVAAKFARELYDKAVEENRVKFTSDK